MLIIGKELAVCTIRRRIAILAKGRRGVCVHLLPSKTLVNSNGHMRLDATLPWLPMKVLLPSPAAPSMAVR